MDEKLSEIVNVEYKKDDVFIDGHPFKVVAKVMNGDYVYWKFSAKGDKEGFYIGPHHFAGKEDKEKEHYDTYLKRKKIGKLPGIKPPKFAGIILRTGKDMMYPMLNGYICVSNYGLNGENGFIGVDQFNRMRRLYKVIGRNNIGEPILVARIRKF